MSTRAEWAALAVALLVASASHATTDAAESPEAAEAKRAQGQEKTPEESGVFSSEPLARPWTLSLPKWGGNLDRSRGLGVRPRVAKRRATREKPKRRRILDRHDEAPERVKPDAPAKANPLDAGRPPDPESRVAERTERPPSGLERLVLRAPLLHRGGLRDASAVTLATGLGIAARLISSAGSGALFLLSVSVLALLSTALGPAALFAIIAAAAVGHVTFVSLMSAGAATLGFDVASADFELPFLRLFGQQFLAEALAVVSGGLLAFHFGAFALALDTSSLAVQILLPLGALAIFPLWLVPMGALFLLAPSLLMFGGVVVFAEPTSPSPLRNRRRTQVGGLRFTF